MGRRRHLAFGRGPVPWRRATRGRNERGKSG